MSAYQSQVSEGWLRHPKRCKKCKGKLSEPFEEGDLVRVCCQNYNCRDHSNVIDYSVFGDHRFKGPQELSEIITAYCNQPWAKAPRVTVIENNLTSGAGRCKVEAVFNVLRQLEAEAGLAQSKVLMLKGRVEGDGHGIRRTFISTKNENFTEEDKLAASRNPKQSLKA